MGPEEQGAVCGDNCLQCLPGGPATRQPGPQKTAPSVAGSNLCIVRMASMCQVTNDPRSYGWALPVDTYAHAHRLWVGGVTAPGWQSPEPALSWLNLGRSCSLLLSKCTLRGSRAGSSLGSGMHTEACPALAAFFMSAKAT